MTLVSTQWGFRVSSNAKTGHSINSTVCLGSTPWCRAHCYGRFRPRGPLANTGPITWRKAQAVYRKNTEIICECRDRGRLEDLAADIAALFDPNAILRGNGLGDLFPGLTELYALMASMGVKLFLFSRVPEEIRRLTRLCIDLNLDRSYWPHVLGSVDSTTTSEAVDALSFAVMEHKYRCNYINYQWLAFACTTDEEYCTALKQDWWDTVAVVFGYHGTRKRTVLKDPKECPAAAGYDIKCNKCRRCYGHLQ